MSNKRELPELGKFGPAIFTHNIEILTDEQKAEVVRRCNNWEGLISAARDLLDAYQHIEVSEDYFDKHLEPALLEFESWVNWEEQE